MNVLKYSTFIHTHVVQAAMINTLSLLSAQYKFGNYHVLYIDLNVTAAVIIVTTTIIDCL